MGAVPPAETADAAAVGLRDARIFFNGGGPGVPPPAAVSAALPLPCKMDDVTTDVGAALGSLVGSQTIRRLLAGAAAGAGVVHTVLPPPARAVLPAPIGCSPAAATSGAASSGDADASLGSVLTTSAPLGTAAATAVASVALSAPFSLSAATAAAAAPAASCVAPFDAECSRALHHQEDFVWTVYGSLKNLT